MMAPVSRSLRAVEVLSDVDPVFQEICGVLYGPAVDPQEIWEDVFKASPDSADVDGPSSGSSLKRRLAFASTAAGAVLGAKELGEQLPKLGGRVGAGAERAMGGLNSGARKIVPTGVRRAVSTPRGRVAVAGTALGGDVIAGNELDPRKQQGVQKAAPSVGEMAEGIQSKLKRLMPTARAVDPKPATPLGSARAGSDPSVSSAYSSGQRPPGSPQAPGASPSPAAGANPTTPSTQAPPGAAGQAPSPAQAPGTPPAGGPAQPGPTPGSTPPPTPGGQAGPAPAGGRTPQSGAPGSESHTNGQAIGQLVDSATGTPARKVIVGGAAAAAAVRVHSNRQQGQQQGQDPYAAYYGKRDDGMDFSATVRVQKFDDEKHLAFGWASVTKLNGHPVLDRQGDYIDADDLEDAAVRFMQDSRKGGHMHRRTPDDMPVHVSDIVESVVFTDEKVHKLGLPENFPRGWWVGVKIHDDDVWDEVRKGGLPGFSIHGRGKRSPLDPRELAGVR